MKKVKKVLLSVLLCLGFTFASSSSIKAGCDVVDETEFYKVYDCGEHGVVYVFKEVIIK
ncbi:MAG: hypothetical protein AAF693_00655 [Bacteroidota bacterium]